MVDNKAELFEEVLRYIYTDQIESNIMEKLCMELLVAAIKYLLEDLKLSSLDYFQGKLWLMGRDLQQ